MYHSTLWKRKAFVVAAAAAALSTVSATAATAASDPIKCQQAISAAAQKYEDARSKTVQKCEEAKLKGKLASDIDCSAAVAPPGDQKTVDKIGSADQKRSAAIAKACGGDDKAFGGSPDIAIADINWDGRTPGCDLGERDGLACQTNADCPSRCTGGIRDGEGVNCPTDGALNSSCPSGCVGLCVAGSNAGEDCFTDGDCPGSTCGGKACVGGTNNGNACTTSSDCPGSNPCQQSKGCGFNGKRADACPGIESGNCNDPIAGPADIDACVKCVSETAADQVVGTFYANLTGVSTDKALEKCKQAIGKNVVKFFSAHRKALAGCQKGALKAGTPDVCPDSKATGKISSARTKLTDSIAKACGGDDKALGGSGANADLTPDAIGAPLYCPNVDPPGATPSCYFFISNLQDLSDCAVCLADFKAAVLDAVAVPADDPVPAELNTLCGNGKIDSGESCDDGNVVDGDGCPGDCLIETCSPSGTATVTVSFTDPTASVTGLTVYLDYPETAVQVPGSGNSAAVQNSISLSVPNGNATFSPNDLNYAIRTLVVDNDEVVLPAGPLLDIVMQRCGAVPLPSTGDFNCRVEGANASGGVGVFSSTCIVSAVN